MDAATPKQYLPLAGSTVIEHSLRTLLDCEQLQAVAVALRPGDSRAAGLAIFAQPRVMLVEGGEQRSDSVLAALTALLAVGDARDWVLVHDAARPCLQASDLARLMEQVVASGTGGILAEPIVDTVKQASAAGLVLRSIDRSGLWRAQTPQMFRLGELHAALQRAREQGLAVTDEASAMELAGHAVQLVAGSTRNLKVTVPADLELAAWYLGGASGS